MSQQLSTMSRKLDQKQLENILLHLDIVALLECIESRSKPEYYNILVEMVEVYGQQTGVKQFHRYTAKCVFKNQLICSCII